MELTFYHNYIENTTACGTVLTEHLLNAGRRPQTSERARKFPCRQIATSQIQFYGDQVKILGLALMMT